MHNFTIVIPAYNESANLNRLIEEIYFSLNKYENFELIIVDDCSNDNTADILDKLILKFSINILRNLKNYGQSYSICEGIKKSKYNTIVTLDGDGQNDPKDIPKLLDLYLFNKDVSLVGGIRKNRKDNIIKIFSSKIANTIRSFILDDNCIDTGCSLKVFNKNKFLEFPYFNGIHRFIPALFKGYGHKAIFIDVSHRKRISGISKYGTFGRLYKGIKDLIKVKLIINSIKK